MTGNKNMIIGVTGGIACGKSEVCRILREAGYLHIDADDVAHEVLERPEIITAIRNEFGADVLTVNEEGNPVIDRKALGRIVFNDIRKRKTLESITHPKIIERIKEMISAASQPVVIEAVQLLSSGLGRICDFVWFIDVNRSTQLQRLVEGRHLTVAEAESRLRSQNDNDWNMACMDEVISSSVPMKIMEENVLKTAEKCYNLFNASDGSEN